MRSSMKSAESVFSFSSVGTTVMFVAYKPLGDDVSHDIENFLTLG